MYFGRSVSKTIHIFNEKDKAICSKQIKLSEKIGEIKISDSQIHLALCQRCRNLFWRKALEEQNGIR